jgi:hypothetical protein
MYVEEPPPLVLAIALGEYFYNLRAALDGAVYDAAVADTGKEPPPKPERLQFPVAVTREMFRRSLAQIEPLSIDNKRLIEASQPYRGPEPRGTALYWVNEMARKDRHRHLHLLGAWLLEANIAVDAPAASRVVFEHLDPRGFVRDSAVVGRFRITPYSPGDSVRANPNASLDFEIEQFVSRSETVGWLRLPMARRLAMIEVSTVSPTIAALEFVSAGHVRTGEAVTSNEMVKGLAERSDFWPPSPPQ